MTRHGLTVKERMLTHVEIDEDGCWVWQASQRRGGYAAFYVDKEYPEHTGSRIAYIEWIGPIPEGYLIDHECHNRAALDGLCVDGTACKHRLCINPDHLVAKPSGDNLRASPLTQASINKAKTHCKRGHEFTDENTGRKKDGHRYCRTCNSMTKEERREFDANMQVNGVDSNDT